MLNVTLNEMLSFLCTCDERVKRQETNCDRLFEHFEKIYDNLYKCETEIKAEMNKATTVTKYMQSYHSINNLIHEQRTREITFE